jgi:hypothetical protein
MCTKMTRKRAEEFGAAWNSGDADLVASFFVENGVYHASVGPDALGKSYAGKDNINSADRAEETASYWRLPRSGRHPTSSSTWEMSAHFRKARRVRVPNVFEFAHPFDNAASTAQGSLAYLS